MPEFDPRDSWWGIGAKGGGILGIVGVEGFHGGVINCATPQAKNTFQILNIRLGLGLGGSAGLCAIFIFNCQNLWMHQGEEIKDWGINVSMGEKWSDFVKGLKGFKIMTRAAQIGSKMKGVTPGDLEDARNLLHYVWNGYDLGTSDKSFKMITLDIPGTGIGYELSAAFSSGKLEVDS